jgi:uncharacterized protein YgiM (DUF1202 family)
MKIKLVSLLLIGLFVFTALSAFASDAKVEKNKIVPPAVLAESNALFLNYNLNMEYCTVDLADTNSSLNVRTWEGRVVGKLRHGTSVWINQYSGDWALVSVKRGKNWYKMGWVDSSYLLC